MNNYAYLCCILAEYKCCDTQTEVLSAVTRVTKTPESHFLLYVLFIRSRSCHGSMSEFVGTVCLTQGHSEGRHRHTAPRAPPQVFLLTNTIGQRNRNTLAINSKHRPSVTTNSKNLAANKSTGAGRKARPVEKSNSTKQAKLTTRKVAKVFNDHDLYIARKRSSGGTGREVLPAFRLDATGHAWPRGRRRASARKTAPSKGDVDSTAGAMEYGRESPQETVPRRCTQRPARSRLDKAPKRRAQLAPPTAALPNPADDPSLECAAEERGAGQWPGAVTSPLP